MEIINKTKNTVLANKVEVADSLCKRMIGLLNRRDFKKGQALIIKPCQSIHTLFMRFPIDVIFVDRQDRVIKVIPQFKPWHLSGIYIFAHSCIELPIGSIASSLTSEGDLISF